MASPLFASPASAAQGAPGAPGLGDSYFPLDGNGGYSGDQLDDLFTTWFYTSGKPPTGPDGAPATTRSTTTKPTSYDRIDRTAELLAAAGGGS